MALNRDTSGTRGISGIPVQPDEGGFIDLNKCEGDTPEILRRKFIARRLLSPTRSEAELPFLLSLDPSLRNNPTPNPPTISAQDNEKYKKLMLKKQKRETKKEKNVLNVFKAEDIEGHKGEDDLNSVLQSMGEKVEAKKVKVKKREKIDKSKVEKRERGRSSAEKELREQEEEMVQEIVKQEEKENFKVVNRIRSNFVDEDLVAFKNNFSLVTPESSPLAHHKSRECMAGSAEPLPRLTKVTSKYGTNRKEKGKPPPGPAAPLDGRRTGYVLRPRDTHSVGVVREQTGSPAESVTSQREQCQPSASRSVEVQLSVESQNSPKPEKEDFPALPEGRERTENSEVCSNTALPSAWARGRVVTKDSDNIVTFGVAVEEAVTNPDTVGNNLRLEVEIEDFVDHIEATEADKSSDHLAVIHCDVPSDSPDQEGAKTDFDNVASSELKNSVDIAAGSEMAADICADMDVAWVVDCTENTEVVISEDKFNNGKADSSAPVVIFSETDQDRTSSEFTFGFDINLDLVSSSNTVYPMKTNNLAPQNQPNQMSSMPGPMGPLTPIDTVDGAILSFAGPDPMRPVTVGIPVGVPAPVSVGGHLQPLPFYPKFANGAVLPPPFPTNGLRYDHQLPRQGALIQHQFHEDEPEVDVEKGGGHDQNCEDHTVSSPSLPAPGSYPHLRGEGWVGHAPLPLASRVSQSLSGLQGHCSEHSDISNSSQSSPVPGCATQKEEEDLRQQDSDKTNDNGLVSENFTSLLEKDLKQINSVKFNLGEIVKFISSSWSSVSQDTTVQWFSVASSGQSNVMD